MTKDLNRIGAEKIMGWISGPYVRQTSRQHINPVEEDAYFTKDGAFVCYVNDFTPLTDMNQCMMVVERMKGLGWRLTFYNDIDNKPFCCVFIKGPQYYWSLTVAHRAYADTPNEAILTAALKAVGAWEE